MADLVNQLLNMLLPILATIITGVFTYVGTTIRDLYKNKMQDETKKKVAQDCVKFVQQVYEDLEGKEKFYKAVEQANQVLEGKGIYVTEAEMQMIIESAVYGLKKGWLNEGTKE